MGVIANVLNWSHVWLGSTSFFFMKVPGAEPVTNQLG